MLPPSSRYDRDIDAPADTDLLGRKRFAKRLASLIERWSGEKSLVIGLFGEWGAGKTTVKNFVLREFERSPEPSRPIVVNFNPWEWDGPSALRAAFFAEIGKELLGKDDETADVGRKLKNYAAVLSVSASILASAERLTAVLAPVAAPFVATLRGMLEQSSSVVKEGGEVDSSEPRPLAAVKAEVAAAMRSLTRSVLVVVDDVDRLTAAETGQLFQLIKANGDFPRTVYLVLCDRDAVERALNDLVKDRGRDFLEKIVNVSFDLPRSSDFVLERTLLNGLQEILNCYGMTPSFDSLRWEDNFDEALVDVFGTLRDVKRYLATIEFTIADLAENWKNDFDVIDFLLLEVLRVFLPEVYGRVSNEKLRLTQKARFPKGEDPTLTIKDPKQAVARIVDWLVDGVEPPSLQRAAKAIVIDLFPSLRGGAWSFGGSRGRQAPVASFTSFDRYFFFGVHTHDLTAELKKQISRSRSSYDAMLALLENSRDEGWLPELIGHLDEISDPLENPAPLIVAFADFLDDNDHNISTGRYSLYGELVRLAWGYMRRVEENRSSVYLQVFRAAKGISLLFALLPENKERDSEFIVDGPTIREARANLGERVRMWSVQHLKLRHAASNLVDARSRLGSDEPLRIAKLALGNGRDALLLLRAFTYRQLIEVGRPRKRHGEAALQPALQELVALNDLLRVVCSVPTAELTPSDAHAISLLEVAVGDAIRRQNALLEQHDTDSGSAGG